MRKPVVGVVVVVALWAAMAAISVRPAHAALNPAPVDFSVRAEYATGDYPGSLAVGDLNGDGRLDLVAADKGDEYYQGAGLSVLLAQSSGGFGPKTDFASGGVPWSVAIGDLNGDGHPDLAAVNDNMDSVSVLFGDGTGGFGPNTDFHVVDRGLSNSLAVGDLNGDGRLDLAVTNNRWGTVSVLLGDGAGGFGPKTYEDTTDTFRYGTDFATGGYPAGVGIGDLNGDGRLDLAISVARPDAVSVLLGDGTGRFPSHTLFASGQLSPRSVAIGDLNGDRHLDLVVANPDWHGTSVLLGNGTGRYDSHTDFATGDAAYSAAIGDLNGDGHPDLAVTNEIRYEGEVVSVLPGDGMGGFGPITDYATGSTAYPRPYAVAIADLTGDGRPDLAVANGALDTVSVLRNSPGPTKPGAPTIRSVTAGDGAVTISWNPPVWDGGSPVTGYVVTPYEGWVNPDPRPPVTFDSTATTQTVTGLTNGTTYTFKVAAINAKGTGHKSAYSSAVTPVTLPGSPTIRSVTAGDGVATISWYRPATDGGSPITGYLVTPYIGSSPQQPVTFNSIATTETVTGLNNGTTYRFAVQAFNTRGTGAFSVLSPPVIPGTPGAPVIGEVLSGDARATVSWTAPANQGAAPVTGYVVTPYVGYAPQPPTTFDETATTQMVTGLANGTTYRFAVQALNANGAGSRSSVSKSVTPGSPDAPTIGTAVAGDAQATVSWTAPSNEGAARITGYAVTPYVGYAPQPTVTFDSTATTETVTGLANGTTYRFRVQGVSAMGTGAYSKASNAVTPVTRPDAPTIGQADVDYPNVTLRWTAPASNGGSPLTGYVVTPYLDSTAQSSINTSTATAITVTGLTDDATYTFTVAARNAVGTGPESAPSNPVTVAPTVPGPPTIGTATAGNGRVTVSWTAPASDGGAPISGYIVTPYVASWTGRPRTFDSTATTQVVTGVTNGWPYRFRVQAVNALGAGGYSAESNRVIPTAG